MPDYSKGKIYKIVCNETGLVYIGSTTQNLNTRISDHKKDYNAWLDGKINWQCTSFAIIQFDNYYIELIEDYPCENKTELEMREGYWQKQIDCVNKFIAGRTRKEYDKLYRQKSSYKEYHRNYQKKWFAKKLELQSKQNNNLDV